MTNPRSLSYQCSCIRDCLSLARTDDIRAGLEGAIETIEKVQAARDPIRAVLAIFDVFPGARIEDVREVSE